MNNTSFYMVCRKPTFEGSKTEPRKRYASIGDARDAARKLAKQTDRPFVILQSVETVRPNDDQQKDLF